MTEPGWYPDPQDPSRNLYWDGRAWHRNGAPPAPIFDLPPPGRLGCMRGIVKTGLMLLGGFVLLAGCIGFLFSGGSDRSSSGSSSLTRTTTTTPIRTVDESSTEVAPSTNSDDDLFLLALKSEKIDIPDLVAIRAAKAVCADFANGESQQTVVVNAIGNTGLYLEDAGFLAGVAVGAYCPQFEGAIR